MLSKSMVETLKYWNNLLSMCIIDDAYVLILRHGQDYYM
jgi:hypothetical protein